MANQKTAADGHRSPTSRETKTSADVAANADVEGSGGEDVAVQKAKVSKIGERPTVFKNTFQEVSFVFMATVAMATNTFLTGTTVIVTASIGKDLNMSQSQISWISAATT
jgi:hypothetical protein